MLRALGFARRSLRRLNDRIEVPPKTFEQALATRHAMHGNAACKPKRSLDYYPGTYVLAEIDDLYRRTYERV